MSVPVRVSTAPDEELVGRAAAGDREAFEALYDRLGPRVHDLALRITGSEADAADALQETFTALLRRLLRGGPDRPIHDVTGYVVVTARHASLRIMSERGRATPVEVVPEPRPTRTSGRAEPEREALAAARREEVRLANERLPVRHREVLALRHVAGWSYDEIARHMGLSANAVAQLVWRARTGLRRELRSGALASVPARSEACEVAMLLVSRCEDGEVLDPAEELWLDQHLDECDSCRLNRAALLEVGATYGAWLPVAGVAMGAALLRDRVLDGAWTAAHAGAGGAVGTGAGGGTGTAGAGGGAGAAGAGGAGGGLATVWTIVAAGLVALAAGSLVIHFAGHHGSVRKPATPGVSASGRSGGAAAGGSANPAARGARAGTAPGLRAGAALRRARPRGGHVATTAPTTPASSRAPLQSGAAGPKGANSSTGPAPFHPGGGVQGSGGGKATPTASPLPLAHIPPPARTRPPAPGSALAHGPPPGSSNPPVHTRPPVTTPPTATTPPPPPSTGVNQGCAPALPPGQIKKGRGAPGNSGHGCRGRR